jgi:hypothetical protein
MKVSPEQLVPSQDFLKPHTVAFILECIRKGNFDQLPPTPIIREGENGELIAIDGHNLIAVKLHRNEQIEVHLAKSRDDSLPANTEANIQRNNDLRGKFDFVLTERVRLHNAGVDTFQDLIGRYKDLFQD